MKYQCGSCEQEFKKLKDGSCPNCGSGNFVKGNIDDNKIKENNMFICVVCKEKFDDFYKDKDSDSTCKYCVEFETHNNSLKEEEKK